jgi:hypothetical protein
MGLKKKCVHRIQLSPHLRICVEFKGSVTDFLHPGICTVCTVRYKKSSGHCNSQTNINLIKWMNKDPLTVSQLTSCCKCSRPIQRFEMKSQFAIYLNVGHTVDLVIFSKIIILAQGQVRPVIGVANHRKFKDITNLKFIAVNIESHGLCGQMQQVRMRLGLDHHGLGLFECGPLISCVLGCNINPFS